MVLPSGLQAAQPFLQDTLETISALAHPRVASLHGAAGGLTKLLTVTPPLSRALTPSPSLPEGRCQELLPENKAAATKTDLGDVVLCEQPQKHFLCPSFLREQDSSGGNDLF